jgi:hypothetical protein
MIRRQLENAFLENAYITIFDAPAGKLAPLPDAVGGDPTQWTRLEASAAAFAPCGG